MCPYTHSWVMVDEQVFEWKLGAEGSFSVTLDFNSRLKEWLTFGPMVLSKQPT